MHLRSLLCATVLIATVSLPSCSRPTAPTMPPSESQNAASTATGAATEADTASQSSEPAASSLETPAANPTAEMPSTATSSPAGPTAKETASAPDTSAASPSKPSTPPAAEPIRAYEPTPEQLAKWKQPEFKPLQLLACRDLKNAALITASLMMPDGKQFLTGGTRLTLWSLDADHPIQELAKMAQDSHITTLALAPNGKWFAFGDSVGNVQVWSVADKKLIHEKKLYPTGVVQLVVSPMVSNWQPSVSMTPSRYGTRMICHQSLNLKSTPTD